MTREQLCALPVGTRVRIVRDIELYPLNIYHPGMTGVISDEVMSGSGGVLRHVRLDKLCPELDEWDNQLQVNDPLREDAGVCTPDAWEVL